MKESSQQPFSQAILKRKRQLEFLEWKRKVVLYCDLPGKYRNRRFSFDVPNIVNSCLLVDRFKDAGNTIRMARHYEENKVTGEEIYFDVNI